MKVLTLAELKTFLTIQISCLILATLLILSSFSWLSTYYVSFITVVVFLILAALLLLGSLIYFLRRKVLSRRWIELGIAFYGVLGVSMAALYIFYS